MITKNLNELEQLRLSARVRRFLDDRGIHTVDQLCSLSVHSVLTGPSMGSAEVIQIAGELGHVGRKWPTDSSRQAKVEHARTTK